MPLHSPEPTRYTWRGREWDVEIRRFDAEGGGYVWHLGIARDGKWAELRYYDDAADAAIAVVRHETGDLRWDCHLGGEQPPDDLGHWQAD